jgi:hypothetical protein
MSDGFSIDRESFQTFLANVFVVQESGLDKEALSALIEVERFIASDEFDLERAMIMIADRTLDIFHASGVSIALLEASGLAYRAGSGSAAGDVGRHVPAVLIVPSPPEARREILRVENAASDTRIEAEICRQFGAMSLLILPVYKKDVLVGVLQVLFNDAHPFLYREVLTYRLMVGALEEAMLCNVRSAQKEAESLVGRVPDDQIDSPPYLQSVIAKAWATVAKTGERNISRAQPASKGRNDAAESTARAWRNYRGRIMRELSGSWRELTAVIRTTVSWPWNTKVRSSGAAISAALALSTAIWVFYPHHLSSAKNSGLSALTRHGVQQQARPLLNPEPSHGSLDATGSGQTVVFHKEHMRHGKIRGFRRLRVAPNEVDYFAEGVTIKQFESRPPNPRIQSVVKEMEFGDDVTVRYFAAAPGHFSQPPSPAETRDTDNR